MNKYEIEADISYFEKCKELCDKNEFNIVEVKISKQICERVIYALLKQYPAKLSTNTVAADYRCKRCGNVIDYSVFEYEIPNYCKYCGQKIDWSE